MTCGSPHTQPTWLCIPPAIPATSWGMRHMTQRLPRRPRRLLGQYHRGEKANESNFAIGALSPADVLTSFSSRGPMYDGRIIPHVVIEGVEGTSDAAPKVTGELAILAQVYKAKNGGVSRPPACCGRS